MHRPLSCVTARQGLPVLRNNHLAHLTVKQLSTKSHTHVPTPIPLLLLCNRDTPTTFRAWHSAQMAICLQLGPVTAQRVSGT